MSIKIEMRDGKFKKGHMPWSKGLTKDTDERVKRISDLKKGKMPKNINLFLLKANRFQKGRKSERKDFRIK